MKGRGFIVSYRERRKQAKTISEVKETARLIFLGVQKLRRSSDEQQVENFIESCKQSQIFTADTMRESPYEFSETEIAEVEHFEFTDIESCVTYGELQTTVAQELAVQAEIPKLFYPFFPTSVSNISFTTLEVLLFFLVGLSLYIII